MSYRLAFSFLSLFSSFFYESQPFPCFRNDLCDDHSRISFLSLCLSFKFQFPVLTSRVPSPTSNITYLKSASFFSLLHHLPSSSYLVSPHEIPLVFTTHLLHIPFRRTFSHFPFPVGLKSSQFNMVSYIGWLTELKYYQQTLTQIMSFLHKSVKIPVVANIWKIAMMRLECCMSF